MLSGFTARQSTCRVVRRVSLRYHPSHATQGPSESLLPIPTQRFFARMTPYRHLNLRLQDLRSWTNPLKCLSFILLMKAPDIFAYMAALLLAAALGIFTLLLGVLRWLVGRDTRGP
jgi:hypothetical protein